jgi:hypothetical protein
MSCEFATRVTFRNAFRACTTFRNSACISTAARENIRMTGADRTGHYRPENGDRAGIGFDQCNCKCFVAM